MAWGGREFRELSPVPTSVALVAESSALANTLKSLNTFSPIGYLDGNNLGLIFQARMVLIQEIVHPDGHGVGMSSDYQKGSIMNGLALFHSGAYNRRKTAQSHQCPCPAGEGTSSEAPREVYAHIFFI